MIFFFCQNLIHVGLILADESGQNLLFKNTFIFLVVKLLTAAVKKMKRQMIVDLLRSESWENLNSGRKQNNRLNFVPNFDLKSVGNGSKLAFSAEN